MHRLAWGTAILLAGALVALQPAAARQSNKHRHHHAVPAPTTSSGDNTPSTASPQQRPTQAAPTTPSDTGKPPAIVVDTQDAVSILGKSVRSSAGEDMGRLIDVIVGRDRKPRAAVIDFGGFLGVGSRKIAVDWQALHFSPNDPKGSVITLELTRDQVKAAPEYKEGNPIIVLGALGGLQQMPFTSPDMQEK